MSYPTDEDSLLHGSGDPGQSLAWRGRGLGKRGCEAAILSPAVHLPPPEPTGSLPPSTPRLTAPECTTQSEAPLSRCGCDPSSPRSPRPAATPASRRPSPAANAHLRRPRAETAREPSPAAGRARSKAARKQPGARSARSAPAAPPSPLPAAPTCSQSLSTAILPFPRARTYSSPLRRCQRREPGDTEGTARESSRSWAREGDSPATARPPPPASQSPAPARGSRSPARPPLYRKCRPLPAGPPLTSPRAASRRPGRRCLLPPAAAPRSPRPRRPPTPAPRSARSQPKGEGADADPPQQSHPRARHRWAIPRRHTPGVQKACYSQATNFHPADCVTPPFPKPLP